MIGLLILGSAAAQRESLLSSRRVEETCDCANQDFTFGYSTFRTVSGNVTSPFGSVTVAGRVCQLQELVPVLDIFANTTGTYTGRDCNHSKPCADEVSRAASLAKHPDVISSTELLRKRFLSLLRALNKKYERGCRCTPKARARRRGIGAVAIKYGIGSKAQDIVQTRFDGSYRSYNVREFHDTVYKLMKSSKLNDDLRDLAKENNRALDDLVREGVVNRDALLQRAADVERAAAWGGSCDKYGEGIPDMNFPGFASAVRFDFDKAKNSYTKAPVGSRPVSWSEGRTRLDDVRASSQTCSSVQPKLSTAGLAALGANNCTARGDVPLEWKWIGADTLDIPTDTVVTMADNTTRNGFFEWASQVGYARLGGPSGTTANTLQLCKLLGFTPNELVKMRRTMLAYLVPGLHNSAIEIFLGANDLMPDYARMEALDVRSIDVLFEASSQ